MILISFGKWDIKGGRFFIWERMRIKDYIWTPFCKVSLRCFKAAKEFNKASDEIDKRLFKKLIRKKV